ncbi:hypothetical protein ACQKGC_08320 [Allorhizobium pseudoryzae]|uniref:hypothetical protein n=1 Tax=Allorhizobium pseudoryzae TaxID=379684 RepID=UPI003CFCD200
MSCFLSVADDRELCLLSDAGAWDSEGRIFALDRKIHVSQRFPVAITTRGSHALGRIQATNMITMFDRYGVDWGLYLFHELCSAPEMQADPRHGINGCLHWHVGAFSPTVGPIRLSFHNMPHAFSDGHEPGKCYEVTETYAAGTPADAYPDVPARFPFETLSSFTRRSGPAIFDAWRRTPTVPFGYDRKQYLCAGWVDMVTITRKRAYVETIHKWPDMVGEIVGPEAAYVAH